MRVFQGLIQLLPHNVPVNVIAGLIAVCVASSPLAHAYPENVRHGYTNCVSCHTNPNGAGLLNEYGRHLSKDLQSYGKFFFEPAAKAEVKASVEAGDDRDPETEFLYGYVPRAKGLNLGGDLRFLQLFSNTPKVSSARFIVMQLDLEAAVTVGKLTFDATIGRVDPTVLGNANPDFGDYLISRRHFVLYQATDEIFVMGGRFWKPHGILDPNHSSAVKEYLGWNFGSESYNLEAGYIGNALNVLAYADFGRPDTQYYQIEKGGGATVSLGFLNTYKAGISYFYGETETIHRHVVGPWGILGFSDRFYLRTENDFVRTMPTATGAASTSGFATYNRLGYEVVQGFHGFAEQGFNRLDWNTEASQLQTYGLGVLYYPRAHWEFEADYQKRKAGSAPTSQGFTDYIYLQAHYYL